MSFKPQPREQQPLQATGWVRPWLHWACLEVSLACFWLEVSPLPLCLQLRWAFECPAAPDFGFKDETASAVLDSTQWFKGWKCSSQASSHQGPSPFLRPDYFITVCLQAGIALLKPQIIIITIIRNSCGGGIGTRRENIWVCPLSLELLLWSSGDHKACGFYQSQWTRRLSGSLIPPVKTGMRWGSFF